MAAADYSTPGLSNSTHEDTLPLDNPGEQQCEPLFHPKGRQSLGLGTVGETQAGD